MRLLVVLCVLGVSSPALAQALPRDEAPDALDAPTSGVELLPRAGVGLYPNAAFAWAGVDGMFRLSERWRVGGGAQSTLFTRVGSGDDCSAYGQCAPSFQRLQARAELHLLPGFFVDPWAAVAPGVAIIDAGAGEKAGAVAEITLEGGLDFRLSRQIALGATLGVTRAAGSRPDFGDSLALGLRMRFGFGGGDAVRTASGLEPARF